jgi:hypothetical protein
MNKASPARCSNPAKKTLAQPLQAYKVVRQLTNAGRSASAIAGIVIKIADKIKIVDFDCAFQQIQLAGLNVKNQTNSIQIHSLPPFPSALRRPFHRNCIQTGPETCIVSGNGLFIYTARATVRYVLRGKDSRARARARARAGSTARPVRRAGLHGSGTRAPPASRSRPPL